MNEESYQLWYQLQLHWSVFFSDLEHVHSEIWKKNLILNRSKSGILYLIGEFDSKF